MEKNYTDKITDMKFNAYSYDEEMNYSGEGELLVTITLHEYRKLIQKEAKAEAAAERSQKWELQKQVEELKAQINSLNAAINTLKSPVDEEVM